MSVEVTMTDRNVVVLDRDDGARYIFESIDAAIEGASKLHMLGGEDHHFTKWIEPH